MVSWDPQQAGKAANYLRLDPKEMMTITSQPYSGKKAVRSGYGLFEDVHNSFEIYLRHGISFCLIVFTFVLFSILLM